MELDIGIDPLDWDPNPNRFAEGGEAFAKWKAHPKSENRFSQDRNPYPKGSKEHNEWDTGWEDAFQYHHGPYSIDD